MLSKHLYLYSLVSCLRIKCSFTDTEIFWKISIDSITHEVKNKVMQKAIDLFTYRILQGKMAIEYKVLQKDKIE